MKIYIAPKKKTNFALKHLAVVIVAMEMIVVVVVRLVHAIHVETQQKERPKERKTADSWYKRKRNQTDRRRRRKKTTKSPALSKRSNVNFKSRQLDQAIRNCAIVPDEFP
jgi:hypothetical protein